jgi:hypothetical protein
VLTENNRFLRLYSVEISAKRGKSFFIELVVWLSRQSVGNAQNINPIDRCVKNSSTLE